MEMLDYFTVSDWLTLYLLGLVVTGLTLSATRQAEGLHNGLVSLCWPVVLLLTGAFAAAAILVLLASIPSAMVEAWRQAREERKR